MRYIEKADQPPESIREFIEIQMAQTLPVNLDYENGFSKRKKQLLAELTTEQYGLCAYTGMPIDQKRLSEYNNDDSEERGVSYKAHNEHIKAQSVCKDEAGDKWGIEPCDDINHRNIVAAIEVLGTESERFGAVVRENFELLLPPTNPDCETEFIYSFDGEVAGMTERATSTIDLLRLKHSTLAGYREAWISVFLAPDAWETRDDLVVLIEAVEKPAEGLLKKFSFCISSVAKQLLRALDTGVN